MNFDDVKKLQQKKYREQFGFFLAEGEHLVLELQKALITNPALRSSELYVTHAYEQWQSPFKTHVISERQMAQIADTKTPQGIIALVPTVALVPTALAPTLSMAPAPEPSTNERAIYLHEIQDPGNLGTILRTLGWFGNFRCLLSPGSVDPHNSKVVRASMGAIFHVPIELDVELSALPLRFPRLAMLDMHGETIEESTFDGCDCYLFGNEARGLPDAQIDQLNAQRFTIPGNAAIDSLNVAAAVTICTYEITRRQP